MWKELSAALETAAGSEGWDRNSHDIWLPTEELLYRTLGLTADKVHAIKVQKRSARKSLWQGRLHREPYGLVLLAADEPCDDHEFDRVIEAAKERFNPPVNWADLCFVLNNGKLLGVIEREGLGVADLLKAEAPTFEVATCDPVPDQLDGEQLRNRLQAKGVENFIHGIETGTRLQRRSFLAAVLGVAESQVISSEASSGGANVAKGRWEGKDVDPEKRFHVAALSTTNWTWASARAELVQRMNPPDLSIDVAIVAARRPGTNKWSHQAALMKRGLPTADGLVELLEANGLETIAQLDVTEYARNTYAAQSGVASKGLKVRDQGDEREVQYEVSRPSARIHDAMTNDISGWAVEVGATVTEGADAEAMYDVLVSQIPGRTGKLLLEVKTTNSLGVVRLAVGQLLDYQRVLRKNGETEITPILVLPSGQTPGAGIATLLSSLGIAWGFLESKQEGDSLKRILHFFMADGDAEAIPPAD